MKNYYIPWKSLDSEMFKEIARKLHRRELWCGDFNAHNSLWGSKKTAHNGNIVEEMIDEKSLVCLNNGKGTRVNTHENTVSCLDITLITNSLVNSCEWEIIRSLH